MSGKLFFLCLCLLQGTLLYKASTPIVAYLSFASMAFVIGLYTLLRGSRQIVQYCSSGQARLSQNPFIYLLAFQLWVFLQYLFRISQDLNATLNLFLLGSGFLVFSVVLAYSVGKRQRWLYVSILAMAVLQALYGIYNVISGAEHSLWMPKQHYLGKATGTFVNANHFAAYLNLAVALLVAALMCKKTNRSRTRSNRPGMGFLRGLGRLYSIEGIALLILVLGIFYSKSMGAIMALGLTLIIFPFVIAVIKKQSLRSSLTVILAAIALGIICLLSVDYSVFLAEQEQLGYSLERRIELSLASLRLLMDYWLTGSGGGTFFTVFPEYRNIEIGNAFYYHAHNDYIEFWSDFGLIGVSFLLAFVIMALKKNIVLIFDGRQYQQIFGYASIFATITLAVHSFVDFPLHTTACALIYLSIISINCLDNVNLRST